MKEGEKCSPFIKGALAGLASRLVTSPIDLLKIRFQIQGSPVQTVRNETRGFKLSFVRNKSHTGKHYMSIFDAIRKIVRDEGGVRALWRGNVPGMTLYAAYGGVQFQTFSFLSNLIPSLNAVDQFPGTKSALECCSILPTVFLSTGIGALSASVALTATYPFDFWRTRRAMMTASSSSLKDHELFKIWSKEGLFGGIYRGYLPALVQIAPYMGIVFGAHRLTKNVILSIMPISHHENSVEFVAGGLAGLVGKAAVMPLDTVRRRLQMASVAVNGGDIGSKYSFTNVQKYNGMLNCVKSIWATEGVRGFYAGISLALFKAVPASAITFLVYNII